MLDSEAAGSISQKPTLSIHMGVSEIGDPNIVP